MDVLKHSSAGENAIKNVCLSIKAGEKVAICGRSGRYAHPGPRDGHRLTRSSGKSTLCFAMLRMLEASNGTISIDERDIARIAHGDLRDSIASVPQDPLLLEGTLRYNLHPLGRSTDARLEAALQRMGIFDGQSLDDELSVEKMSFSEKQLLCLARALVKDRKILVLDEATSR